MVFSCIDVFPQDKKSDDFTGIYQVEFYHTRKIKVALESGRLTFELVGQGKTELKPLGPNDFSVIGLANSTVKFIQDSLGKTVRLAWNHNPFHAVWSKVSESPGNFESSTSDLQPYIGKYALKGNRYQIIEILAENDHLVGKLPGEAGIAYYPTSKNNFSFKYGDYSSTYEFVADKKGMITRINGVESGPIPCIKVMDTVSGPRNYKHNFAERKKFSQADTLQGTLSPLRACYDVLFYDLDVNVDPETKSIHGTNRIRFKTTQDFSELQVDLFANMHISKILFHQDTLPFTRKFDAVFIRFPQVIRKDSIEEIEIDFSGAPQQPDMSTLSGGFFWLQDKNGKPWIEVVSQGAGASLWWPCKDHLSDKPDSMHITVTVPSGLTAISNGQFIGKTELPNRQTRFQWAVHYPINTYNAVLYIGDYVHFSEEYDQGFKFPLNYYCLSYNLDAARKIVQKVKPMLGLYQKDFGAYPFPLDGYALVESPYGMEHQSAVSIGTYSNPQTQGPVDTSELQRMLWHESAHEWWGNAVTCSDYADFWIHESIASYTEVLCFENFYGQSAAEKYLLEQHSDNREPIIGFYGVNDFHTGDMYPKGTRMMATLRCVINNDSLFFGMLQALQKHFAYQSVNSDDVIQFINKVTGTDYSYFFNQYLRYQSIPTLHLSLKPSGNGLDIRYQWKADVTDFRLPVKVSSGKAQFFIYPSSEWKTLHLDNTKAEDFHPDRIHEYYDLKME